MSVHTALYAHKCPGEIQAPQPPALTSQVTVQEEPEEIQPEPKQPEPQFTQAQLLRVQLAQHAQEQRASAHLQMVNPILQFYGI